MSVRLRERALIIWQAGVAAVLPERLLPIAVRDDALLSDAVRQAKRILVVGAGKAGAAMSVALEIALAEYLLKVEGIVNVPTGTERPLERIRLHAARPAGSNHPTSAGVAGANAMLDLLRNAGPDDVGLCLLSGGGSALLPAPIATISLEDKQAVTKLLHASGATIHEMNAVRKHLSRIKGGRLAQAFTGRTLFSLIISDVVGDPLDVIASGPTAADASTFAEAWAILERHRLLERVPASIASTLRAGMTGGIPETLKSVPANVHSRVLGNNRVALDAAFEQAKSLGYRVLDLGSFIEGETASIAVAFAGIVRSIREDHIPFAPPVCLLSGGETTVSLGASSGKGGRNQEFVLAMRAKLGDAGMKNLAILSGGTDGEDGPTDAAGGYLDEQVKIDECELATALADHDAYPLLARCDGLLRTGLTQTNVMDVRVVLIDRRES